jgi:cob(I)alamin adenosyltransferase
MSKNGDKGITQGQCSLNVSKDSVFVELVGAIDRFQSRIGWARVVVEGKNEKQNLFQIEKDLSEIMGSLYIGGKWEIGNKRLGELESEIEEYCKRMGNLDKFLVSGENEIEARINICRTDCREAERRLVTFKNKKEDKSSILDEAILEYLNRLSTLLNWMWRSNLIKK